MHILTTKRPVEMADAIKLIRVGQAKEIYVPLPDTSAIIDVDEFEAKIKKQADVLTEIPCIVNFRLNETSEASYAFKKLSDSESSNTNESTNIEQPNPYRFSTVSIESGNLGRTVNSALLGGVGGTLTGAGTLLTSLRGTTTNPYLKMAYFVIGGIAIGLTIGKLTKTQLPKSMWIDVKEDHSRIGIGVL